MRIMRLRVGVVVSVLAMTVILLCSAVWAQQRPVGQIVGAIKDP